MFKGILRLSSFLVKEIIDVLQQPRLILTLVVGPFLILFIFGLGFVGKQGPIDAIIVVPPEAELPPDIKEEIARYEHFLPVLAILESRDEAIERLKAGEVEMVAVLPTETYSAFLDGRQIVIEILIDEYDPVRVQWVSYISGFLATDLNKQWVSQAVKQGRELASQLQGVSVSLLDRLVEVGKAIKEDDLDLARERMDEILTLLDGGTEGLEPSLEALLGVQIAASVLPVPQEQLQRLLDFVSSLPQFRDQVVELRQLLDDPDLDVPQVLAQVESLRDGVVEMQTVADMLDGIPTQVLVSPLKTEVENVSLHEPDYVGFYAPAVLALLVQHMAVTFGSLTMVRERLLGTEELFRVAPIDPWEIITGKYLGYSLLTAAIGGVLSYSIVVAMKVPLFGSLSDFALVLALLTVASLGWGFLISLFSSRESQSVQFSMLILVASVFFGGFFIPLSGLRTSVHFVSYALPVTYGVQALREIMLAGRAPGPEILLPLAGLSLGFYALCTLIYIRQNRRE